MSEQIRRQFKVVNQEPIPILRQLPASFAPKLSKIVALLIEANKLAKELHQPSHDVLSTAKSSLSNYSISPMEKNPMPISNVVLMLNLKLRIDWIIPTLLKLWN